MDRPCGLSERTMPRRHHLEVDHLLFRRGVAPAELGRPARHEPARVEQLALPHPGPLRDVRRGAGPLREIGGRGGVDVEPGDEIRRGTAPSRRRSGGASGGILAGGTLGPVTDNPSTADLAATNLAALTRSAVSDDDEDPFELFNRVSGAGTVRDPYPGLRGGAHARRPSCRSTCGRSTGSPTTWRSTSRPRTASSATTRSSPSSATACGSRRAGMPRRWDRSWATPSSRWTSPSTMRTGRSSSRPSVARRWRSGRPSWSARSSTNASTVSRAVAGPSSSASSTSRSRST